MEGGDLEGAADHGVNVTASSTRLLSPLALA